MEANDRKNWVRDDGDTWEVESSQITGVARSLAFKHVKATCVL